MSDVNPHGEAWTLTLTELKPGHWKGALYVPTIDQTMSFYGSKKDVIRQAKKFKESELFRFQAEKRPEVVCI